MIPPAPVAPLSPPPSAGSGSSGIIIPPAPVVPSVPVGPNRNQSSGSGPFIPDTIPPSGIGLPPDQPPVTPTPKPPEIDIGRITPPVTVPVTPPAVVPASPVDISLGQARTTHPTRFGPTSAGTGGTKVWDETRYACAATDTLASISAKFYNGNTGYAKALFTHNHNLSLGSPVIKAPGVDFNTPLNLDKQYVFVPEAKILREKYPNDCPPQ
jgi:hypothetical protein